MCSSSQKIVYVKNAEFEDPNYINKDLSVLMKLDEKGSYKFSKIVLTDDRIIQNTC